MLTDAARVGVPLVMYFLSSSLMLLANKVALTLVPAPALVTLMQYVATAAAVAFAGAAGLVSIDLPAPRDPAQGDGTWRRFVAAARYYWPVPFLFSLAIYFNSKMLETANVETFLIFRFATPLCVSQVDFLLMGKTLPSLRGWACFILIIIGAVVYAATDQGFRLESYAYAIAYLVTITTEMIVVKAIFNDYEMSNWTRVLLTNTMSIPFQPMFMAITNEWGTYSQLDLSTQALGAVGVTCVLGLALAYSGVALRALVSATTFTLVGVVCKIVTMVANFLMWDRHASPVGMAALLLSLVGSTLYRPAHSRTDDDNVSWAVWRAIDRFFTRLCGVCGVAPASSTGEPGFGVLKRIELEAPGARKGASSAAPTTGAPPVTTANATTTTANGGTYEMVDGKTSSRVVVADRDDVDADADADAADLGVDDDAEAATRPADAAVPVRGPGGKSATRS